MDWKKTDWEGNREFGAAYSIHTEPLDFAKWMMAVMIYKVLHQESFNELLKPYSEVSDEKFYTLGFFTEQAPYDPVFFHGGHNDGFTCGYVLDVEKK